MMMTEIITPNKTIVDFKGKAVKAEEEKQEKQKTTQLPEVKGYRILCAVPNVDEKYESGLIKADKTKHIEEHSTVVLFVIKLGDMAYQDKDRFPTGPWCKEGDFVITRAYSGTRIKIHGKEFRIINDDTVEAVVDDPRGYERA
jgi:co-chaperonin GroES (HSP10)